ncbi:class I SAM-dependent methyltransferase [Hyphomicrobium sp. D-2]|uniref:class I SAM-dependent methyltransferase n=1 Tax=Hyphomicrobium sp. D-2 TaxID=3041621 RepID=UPI002453C609|nr:class I SAM-dependent methyltransferase [Hyphomicrobium sp. D-2]MDH4981863.1 class I SAM-dependent methyltransferase [Hyphomicrobium sp. D-2]
MSRSSDTREEVPFDRDVETLGSYVYTQGTQLSNIVAVARQSRAVAEALDFSGADVIDIGCGDGAATVVLYDQTHPKRIVGIDPAANAIAAADKRVGDRNIQFAAESAYRLPFPDQSFDIAHLRGVLHHMDEPERAVAEAARVARTVLVLEPNGYNPALKLIEKTSSYHIEHGERSFPPARIDRWLRDQGLEIVRRDYSGLVPYFCSDSVARVLGFVEPLVERLPVLRAIGCGTYVCVGRKHS